MFRFPSLILGLVLVLPLNVPTPVRAQDTTPVSASPVAAVGDFAGLVEIGNGRRMYLECRGQGGPTVVLVSGYGNTGAIWRVDVPEVPQPQVQPAVARFTRVCTYDRPGTRGIDPLDRSRSDPVPQPYAGEDAVADLHALLRAAQVPGPYVFAGHSLGGLLVRLYASTYPDEVAGLVLVDATNEQLRKTLMPAQWALVTANFSVASAELASYPEFERVDLDALSDAMVRAAAAQPLRPLPLVVLSRGHEDDLPPELLAGLPPGFPADLAAAWSVSQAFLAGLLPDARQVIATEAGHYIQVEQPQLVTEAIRQVVAGVRDPASWSLEAAGGDFAGLVDIGGGRKIYLECRGTGDPTVVLVSGLGDAADVWSATLDPKNERPSVFAEVATFTRICAYDRPSTSIATGPNRSTPVPQPTSAKDAAADLDALLRASGEPGPYLLVGHSYGGPIIRLYASAHPADLAGLVLVDALSEDLPNGLTPRQRALFEAINTPPADTDAEVLDLQATVQQLHELPPVPPVPAIVLTADQPQLTAEVLASGQLPAGVDQEFADALWKAQLAAQDKLAEMFLGAEHITNTKSTHYIHLDNPQLVTDSIRRVVDAVRNDAETVGVVEAVE